MRNVGRFEEMALKLYLHDMLLIMRKELDAVTEELPAFIEKGKKNTA